MKLFSPLAVAGLVVSTIAAPSSPTSSSAATPTPTGPTNPVFPASNNIDDFFQCLYPFTDHYIDELKALGTLSYNVLLSWLHWEVIWWGNPAKVAPYFAETTLNTTLLVGCVVETLGQDLNQNVDTVLIDFLKTIKVIPYNATSGIPHT